jgi:hypothetical protein
MHLDRLLRRSADRRRRGDGDSVRAGLSGTGGVLMLHFRGEKVAVVVFEVARARLGGVEGAGGVSADVAVGSSASLLGGCRGISLSRRSMWSS